MHDTLWNLSRKTQQTFVIVTHNELLANRADRALVMRDGRIEL